jgi:hypothetical protein
MNPDQTVFCYSPLLTQVSGLVFDDHNNMYACNFGSPSAGIVKIDKHGQATPLTELYSSDRNFVTMVHLDEFLYVTGFNNCVYKVDIHTGELTTFATLPQNGTNGLVFSNGFFYVICQNGMQSGNVYRITRDGSEVSVFISENTLEGTQYNTISTDEYANLYITDELSNSVVKYSHDGKLIDSKFIPGTFQTVLVHDDAIYLTNYTMNQISKYDLDGKLIEENFACGGLTFAGGGMAFDKKDRFYCSLEGVNGPGIGEVTIQVLKSSKQQS